MENKPQSNHQARETMALMDVFTVKFTQSKPITISRPIAALIILIFLLLLIGTGFITYNLANSPTPPAPPQLEDPFRCENLPSFHKLDEFFISSTTATTSTTKSTTTKAKTEIIHHKLEKLDVRLPRNVIPDFYQVNLIPYLMVDNFTFDGDVRILVNITEASKNVTLHVHDLNIKSVLVSQRSGDHKIIPVDYFRIEKEREFLHIGLNSNLMKGNQYWINITFKGVINDLMQGFYRSSYIENNETRWVASTQFQPTDARRAFPCFDEPSFKARFQINLARPKNMKTLSNMNPILELPQPVSGLSNYVWDRYHESVPMSTYLVAFIVFDFEKISYGNFSVWARPSALNQANYSISIGPKILKFYEEFFGIPYPLPKVDMVAIPDFPAGAMENWGLITYRETVLLFEEGVSSISTYQQISHVVAHELAHQWFGNLVTMKWWSDLWLNEGFATFMEYLGANEVEPQWKNLETFVINEVQSSLVLDALKSSHQISVHVNNPSEVNEIFDEISYSKGAAVIRMMEQFITYRVFHDALSDYLNSRKYGNAEQDDLWQKLTVHSHKNRALPKNTTIKQIMDTWTLQTGFPLITATIDHINKSIYFTQERFLLNKHLNSHERTSNLWHIPIIYYEYGRGQQQLNKFWLNSQKTERDFRILQQTDEDSFLLVNVNQTGYYRVNYDVQNWQKITKILRTDHNRIDVRNRAQLLDDALNSAFSGYLDYEIALNLTEFLKKEREYIVWNANLDNLIFIKDMLERTAHYDKIKLFLLDLIEDFYNELGFTILKSEPPLATLLRVDIISRACNLGLRECRIKAVQQFQNWKNSANPDTDNFIKPDLREVVYCTAISDGGQDEWDFAWQRYLKTNVATERELILVSLGCTKEIWLLSRYLEWSIRENSEIRKQDIDIVFGSVAVNPVGQDLIYKFMKSNWNRIINHLGPLSGSLSTIVKAATRRFNTKEDIDDLKRFYEENRPKLGVALRTTQQAIETAISNYNWMKSYSERIVHWLDIYNKHSIE